MNKLKNIFKVPFEIADILSKSKTIQKLVYNDSPFALEEDLNIDSNILLDENYIQIGMPSESGIENYNHNTMVNINIDNISIASDSVSGFILISTADQTLPLNNNKRRLWEISAEIEKLLNYKKLSTAGEINIDSISFVTLSTFRGGYAIHFSFVDQQSRKAEL